MSADLGKLIQKARAGAASDRREAVAELAGVDAPDALSILQALGAADPDRDVRVLACRAARELRTRLSTGTMEVASSTGVGPPALADRLQSAEPSERAKAIYGCLRYESEKVLGAILDLLAREASPKVRAIAVAAVGVLGSATEAEPMRRFLQDPDLSVRAAADEAVMKLSELGPPLALPKPLVTSVSRSAVTNSPAAVPAALPKPASTVTPAAKPAPPPAPAPGVSRPTTAFSTAARLPVPGRPPGLPPPGGTGAFRIAAAPGTAAGAVKLGMGKPAAGPPLSERMTDDERGRLTRLLTSLSGGVLAEVERNRLADRGSKLYQEVAVRLAMPALDPFAARGLFFLASGSKAQAADSFRAAPRDVFLAPHLDLFLKAALPEDELTALRTAPETQEEVLVGRDKFPPEVLEVVLGALRRSKGLMNELDVPARTKLRIKVEALKDALAAGRVEEGGEAALLLKREMTRLYNTLTKAGPKFPKYDKKK